MTLKVQKGTILLGKYRVEKELGHGAMGYVAAVRHAELGELHAVKLLLPDAVKNADIVKRFEREAKACARLKSEHAVRVHDLGRLEDGSPVMVMEYLIGEDLQRVMDRRKRFPYQEAALYVLQACAAIAEAHELGIVHRDLKPSNLFLTRRPDGTACIKVLDFGISKSLDDANPHASKLTATNTVMGTPYYMSPEQMRNSKETDARGDIWALGIILYEFSTGRVPFGGDNFVDISSNAVFRQPVPPTQLCADIPGEIERIILRCLEKSPNDRFPSVRELMSALRPLAAVAIPYDVEKVAPGFPTSDDAGKDTTTIRRSDPEADDSRATLSAATTLDAADLAANSNDPPQGPSTSHAQRFLRNHTEKLEAQRAKRRRAIAIKLAQIIAALGAVIGSAVLINAEWPSLVLLVSSLKAKGTASSAEKAFPPESPVMPDSAALGVPLSPSMIAPVKSPNATTASTSTGPFHVPKPNGAPSSSSGAPLSSVGAPASSVGAAPSSAATPVSSVGAPASSVGAPSSSTGASETPTDVQAPAKTGTIIVLADPGFCRVLIDGQPVGKTPIDPQKRLPGSYAVTCIKSDKQSVAKSANVKAGDVVQVRFP